MESFVATAFVFAIFLQQAKSQTTPDTLITTPASLPTPSTLSIAQCRLNTPADCTVAGYTCVQAFAEPITTSLCLPEFGQSCAAAVNCPFVGTCAQSTCGGCTVAAQAADCDVTTNPNLPGTICVTAVGSTIGLCGECLLDVHCPTGQFCNNPVLGTADTFASFKCEQRRVLGNTCVRSGECNTLNCTAGNLCGSSSIFGQPCNLNSDCTVGVCRVTGVCGLRVLGEICSANSECLSGSCTFTLGAPNLQTCAGGSALANGQPCNSASECQSNRCDIQGNRLVCVSALLVTGDRCTQGSQCTSGVCQGRFFSRFCT